MVNTLSFMAKEANQIDTAGGKIARKANRHDQGESWREISNISSNFHFRDGPHIIQSCRECATPRRNTR
uniref:Uncharacterized protein n=1 Tax=Picea glauca TaxID=3330 RepID=A0A124GMN3_PICGL|nr:hypothetical protein ABT39_MTgene1727 [Picea glauca]KUM48737.1 hypothetical protein ABT39_MTgene4752 [Picea glauca]